MSSVLAVATGEHVFWLISRAAGTAALLTSSAAVCAGLAMGGRMVKGSGADLAGAKVPAHAPEVRHAR